MIYEIAHIEVAPGSEAGFEAGVQKAVELFRRAKGCSGMRLEKGIESPLHYRLVVQWATLENHTVDFRGSEDFKTWRALVGGFFASPPNVVHSQTVVSGF